MPVGNGAGQNIGTRRGDGDRLIVEGNLYGVGLGSLARQVRIAIGNIHRSRGYLRTCHGGRNGNGNRIVAVGCGSDKFLNGILRGKRAAALGSRRRA
ncbi:hypothetical protein SDC9_81268 [bioreactor metagenome]|uniref:Uncharacterized protein n=1 Tax=bioreactor metagenome TaxID=1076179 RepID=A0A644Z3W1_9ZZZZ